MKRPLFVFGVLFMVSVAALFQCGLWLALGLVPGPVLAAALLPRWQKRQRDGMIACACGAFLCAVAVLGVFDARLALAGQHAGQDIDFTGYVAEVDPYDSQKVLVRARSPQLGRVTLWLRCYDEDDLTEGDWLTGGAHILRALPDGRSLLSGGVVLDAAADGLRLTQPGEGFLWRAARLRAALTERMLAAHPTQGTGVLVGLLFSGQSHLTAGDRMAMERLGTGHILSVSGLHLSVAVGWVLWVCGRMRLGPRLTLLPAGAMVLLVSAMAGFRAPVLRAAVMTALWLAGRALGRRSDSLTSLGAAGCVLTVLCPPALMTTGLRMSFFATLGVAALAGPVTDWCVTWWESHVGRRDGWVRGFSAALAIPLCAQLGLLPVSLLETGFLPVYGIPANMVISVLVWPALLLGALAALALGLAPGALGMMLLDGASWLCQGILAVCRFFAGLPLGVLPMQLPHQWLSVVGMAAAVAACALLRLRGRTLVRVLGASLLLCVMVGLGGTICLRDRVVITAGGGSVAVRKGSTSVLLYGGDDAYNRDAAGRLLLRAGLSNRRLGVLARPGDADPREDLEAVRAFEPRVLLTASANLEEGLPRSTPGVELLPLGPTPVELWPGGLVSAPDGWQTLLETGGEKVLKCWAGYGIISEANIPPDLSLIVDMAGNVYSPGRQVRIWRLWTGDSVAVLKGE